MGRWTQYDEDDYRLPVGMQRIGYDADAGRYYFRDSARSVWQGPAGAQFGEMTRVDRIPPSVALEDIAEDADAEDEDDANVRSGARGDLEASTRTSTRRGGYQLLAEDHTQPTIPRTSLHITTSPYRTLFPFFLIIAVVLLLIWRLILSPGLAAAPPKKCPEDTASHWIQPGDSCWELARERGWGMDKFREANPRVVCDPLMPGTSVCLPPLPGKKAKPLRKRL